MVFYVLEMVNKGDNVGPYKFPKDVDPSLNLRRSHRTPMVPMKNETPNIKVFWFL